MSGRILSLSKKKDFDQVFKAGHSCFDKAIGLKAKANETDQHRLGIIVSTKVSKKAVERNLLKRRLKEIMKKELAETVAGYDLVLITLPGACKLSFAELEQSVGRLTSRLKGKFGVKK
jgi:ribonuclease P protein component